jgi:methylenetetrahydrofolate dehydrogenase (NADP+)/methenyltetrahydrofolate cyclohydrolase
MLLDGKKIQQEIVDEIGDRLRDKKVVFLQFGENAVSQKYVQAKIRIAKKLGITPEYIVSSVSTTKEAVIEVVERSRYSDGIVVQLPLPKGINEASVLASIPTDKDIDLLNPETKSLSQKGSVNIIQPVAGAVYYILEKFVLSFETKNIVILGRGLLVGLPVASLLENKNIKYTIFDKDSDQQKIKSTLLDANIIISGIGVPHFVQPEMISEGTVLIDAGTSEQSGVLLGDIDPGCYQKASLYTPVPGGVGPVAIAMLFKNTLEKVSVTLSEQV